MTTTCSSHHRQRYFSIAGLADLAYSAGIMRSSIIVPTAMALFTIGCGNSSDTTSAPELPPDAGADADGSGGSLPDASDASSGGSGGSLPDATDSSSGGSGGAPDGSIDAPASDGSPTADAVATLGEQCVEPGAMACGGHASKLLLLCDGTHWVANGTCSGDQFCDTRPGSSAGSCQPGAPPCVNQLPNAAVCDGSTLHVCGPDLITETVTECGSPALCAANSGSTCDACSGGDFRCTGAELETCKPDHSGFVLVESCADASMCIVSEHRCMTCLESKTDTAGITQRKDMYLMIERSQAMTQASGWTNVCSGLAAFVGEPATAGMGFGISYFPAGDGKTLTDPGCTGAAYVDPLLPWETYPANALEISSSLSSTQPNGLIRPTQDALNGALLGAKARETSLPDHDVVAVLISRNSDPSMCPVTTYDALSAIAAEFHNGTPGTTIHTIDVGLYDTSLDEIAAAGGGTYKRVATPQAFTAALEAIRDGMAGELCSYPLPTPPAGTLDPATVSVETTVGGSTTPVAPIAAGSSCVSSGWRFDNSASPTRVVLCPASCDTARSNPDNRVTVTIRVCD